MTQVPDIPYSGPRWYVVRLSVSATVEHRTSVTVSAESAVKAEGYPEGLRQEVARIRGEQLFRDQLGFAKLMALPGAVVHVDVEAAP